MTEKDNKVTKKTVKDIKDFTDQELLTVVKDRQKKGSIMEKMVNTCLRISTKKNFVKDGKEVKKEEIYNANNKIDKKEDKK